MVRNDCQFMVDCVSKFHNTLYILGWFYSANDRLHSVRLVDSQEISFISAVSEPHGGVSSMGANLGFRLQSLRQTSHLDLDTPIEFTTVNGVKFSIRLSELIDDRRSRYPSPQLSHTFKELIRSNGSRTLLDIGGRDRSQYDRTVEYPEFDCTVVDILPGDNVDVVGDAHELSSILPINHFDAVISIAVFEHLAMPWRCAVEMNRVMKKGAVGLVYTHQTIGMHDLPWDFFRFSDSTWDSLFNVATGFRILDRCMDAEQFIVPFLISEKKQTAERSAGYEGSAVMFEKISEPTVDWPVRLNSIVSTHYPA